MLVESWQGIRQPLPQFADFEHVPWESGIYPRFKGESRPEEALFFARLIMERNVQKLIDFAVGGGVEMTNILNALRKQGYTLARTEANEVDPAFIPQADRRFRLNDHAVTIHQAPWDGMDNAVPPYDTKFDLGVLLGSSITYVGGNTRAENKAIQAGTISRLAERIEAGGSLIVDTRDYDFLASIIDMPADEMKREFTFNPNIYYQGAQREVTILPVYMDETRICLHYYDVEQGKWGLLELYRVYPDDIKEALGQRFEKVEVYRDFEPENGQNRDKSAFIQYIASNRKAP